MTGELEEESSINGSESEEEVMCADYDQSDCDDGVFDAYDEAYPIHDYLKEDMRRVNALYRNCEEEHGIPAAQIEESRKRRKSFTAVRLTFSISEISDYLKQAWDLQDSAALTIVIDELHRSKFRTNDTFPSVFVSKLAGDDSPFVIGEQLKNMAVRMVEDSFKLPTMRSPSVVGSFFEEMYKTIAKKVPRLSDYCVTCGQKLAAGGVLPTICSRPLCMYQRSTLGLRKELNVPRVSPDVLSLLLYAFGVANMSHRRGDILTPSPPISDFLSLLMEAKKQREGKEVARILPLFDKFDRPIASIFDAASQRECDPVAEYEVFDSILRYMPCPRTFLSSVVAFNEFRQKSQNTAELVDWLVISNKSYLERVPQSMHVDFLFSRYQFCFVSDSPSKQKSFQKLVKNNGGKTRFFFHGSPLENWHSIIRSGLKNMSGTKFQIGGAAHGNGIYLTPHLQLAISYSIRDHANMKNAPLHPHVMKQIKRPKRETCNEAKCCDLEERTHYACVALVEVVDRPEAYSRKTDAVFMSDDQWCSIRMLLLYRTEDVDEFGEAHRSARIGGVEYEKAQAQKEYAEKIAAEQRAAANVAKADSIVAQRGSVQKLSHKTKEKVRRKQAAADALATLFPAAEKGSARTRPFKSSADAAAAEAAACAANSNKRGSARTRPFYGNADTAAAPRPTAAAVAANAASSDAATSQPAAIAATYQPAAVAATYQPAAVAANPTAASAAAGSEEEEAAPPVTPEQSPTMEAAAAAARDAFLLRAPRLRYEGDYTGWLGREDRDSQELKNEKKRKFGAEKKKESDASESIDIFNNSVKRKRSQSDAELLRRKEMIDNNVSLHLRSSGEKRDVVGSSKNVSPEELEKLKTALKESFITYEQVLGHTEKRLRREIKDMKKEKSADKRAKLKETALDRPGPSRSAPVPLGGQQTAAAASAVDAAAAAAAEDAADKARKRKILKKMMHDASLQRMLEGSRMYDRIKSRKSPPPPPMETGWVQRRMPGDLTVITEGEREQIARVVRMFRDSGLEDRVNLHFNGDLVKPDEKEDNKDQPGPSNA